MFIRNAIPADAPAIARVHIRAWQAAYNGLMPADYLNGLDVEARTEQWSDILANPGPGINLVAGRGEAVEGFCVFGPSRDQDLEGKNTGELVALNIDPECWGSGLGRALVEQVIAESRQSGWDALTLWTISQNHRARELYEFAGFSLEGAEKTDSDWIGTEIHELRYIMALKKLGGISNDGDNRLGSWL